MNKEVEKLAEEKYPLQNAKKQAFIEGYKAAINTQGSRWVKALERLPEEAKLVFIRGQKTYMIVGRYIGERLFNGNRYEPMFTDFSNNAKLNWSFDDIEWLEEQPLQ